MLPARGVHDERDVGSAALTRSARLVVVTAAALVGVGVVAAQFAGAGTPATHRCGSEGQGAKLTVADARRFRRFDLFYAGRRVLKLPLSAVICTMQPAVNQPVITRPPESYGLAPSWDFSYGTCQASGSEGGCADPVDIQENDSCWDSPRLSSGKDLAKLPRVRGVPSSASVDSGDGFAELVLYTRSTTITIWAPDLRKATAIASALRGVNSRYTPRSRLPSPSLRTLEGKTRCRNLQHARGY